MGNPEEISVKRPVHSLGELSVSVLSSLLEGCQLIGPDFRYLYVNEAVLRHGRTTREALLGRTMSDCYPGIEQTEMFAILERCMRDRAPALLENEFSFPDGSSGWFELRFEPVPEGVAILSIEITERKRAEIALRRTMRALTTRSRTNQALVRATEEQRFLEDVCQIVVEAGGYQRACIELKKKPRSRAVEVARADSGAPPAGARVQTSCFEICAASETLGALRITSADPGAFDAEERNLLQEIASDVGYGIHTLRQRVAHAATQGQLVAAQRLEAVAHLAGGVAHDFNNLLSVILSYTDLALGQCTTDDQMRSDLEQIQQAGASAAALTRQLLAFSRKQLLEPRVTSPNDVIRQIDGMLERLLGDGIEIAVRLANDVGNVLVDPGQLEQVIMNLAINARDAMPHGGKLTIETENVDFDGKYADLQVALERGRYVRVSVTDTGTGMDAKTKARIFEPFFSTKDATKGTGLGLSVAYGIIRQSGGQIWVYSEPGRGTVFKTYLPRVDASPALERSRRTPKARRGDNETVLLVEDDPAVRTAAKRVLRASGYQVLAAANGNEALALAQSHESHIDLLLTDVVMPHIPGPNLAERLKAQDPSLKVLLTSGYNDEALTPYWDRDAGMRFIGKPFSASDLARRVREVLDETETLASP
jgi:PAS domain S-box-containing protein